MNRSKLDVKGSTVIESLSNLGFGDKAEVEKFLQLNEHSLLQLKFDQVFPRKQTPRLPSLQELKGQESGDELELVGVENSGELMSDDKELELGDLGELDLGGEVDAPAAADAELSLPESGDFSLDLGTDASAPSDGDELKLGDDGMDLDSAALSKLAEIDKIMREDATSATMMRQMPTPEAMDLDLGVSDLGEAELSAEPMDEAPLEMGDGGLDLGGDLPGEASDLSFSSEEPKSVVKTPPKPPAQLSSAQEEIGFQVESDVEMPPAREQMNAMVRETFDPPAAPRGHELERIQATLNHLRSDREDLLKKIEKLEEAQSARDRQQLSMRAELDEKKIELQILKKRGQDENQELRHQLQVEKERRAMAEERIKIHQEELSAMQQKSRGEIRKVSGREKELEQKLELLKSDAETQIRNRDLKILELKRRIDSMEFDMESMTVNEQKNASGRMDLENKLDQAIKTLKNAIGVLENDDPKPMGLDKIKKNLDV